jgi:hypothetical protein
MAKKKNTKASRVKPVNQWSWENTVSLLSWLDFSIKHKDIIQFDDVVDHLAGAFTIEQVDRRLKTLWNRWGPDRPDSPKDWHDVKIRGSQSLHNRGFLDEDQKNGIALAVEELKKTYLPELSTPNRRLRSSSRVETGSLNQDSRLTTPPVEKNGKAQGRKRKFGTDSLTPSSGKHEIVPIDIDSSKTSKARKKPKTYSKRDVQVPFPPLGLC